MTGIDNLDSPLTRTRVMTRDRMRWYSEGLETAMDESGRYVVAGRNIHTDDAAASANGLPGIVADGMITTNWLYQDLTRIFGVQFWAVGSLRTKYIRPVFEDEAVTTVIQPPEVVEVEDGSRVLLMEVWSETQSGDKCTVGEARMPCSGAVENPRA
jgi:3-hydroxybutyryl-CoA dehydratase